MKKLSMILAALAVMFTVGAFTSGAKAMTGGGPIGLRTAIEDVTVTDQVHCVWGWRHHRWRWGHPTWDGCYRGGYVYGPRVYYGPRFYGGHGRIHGHRFHGGGRHIHRGGHRGGGRRHH